MSYTLGLWHIVVEGGKEKAVHLPADLQITNVSFDEEIADPAGRSVVKMKFVPVNTLTYDDEDEEEEEEEKETEMDTTILCALTPGKIEQASVNLILDEDGEFVFSVSGKNTVHLTGNYIKQPTDQEPSDDEDEMFSDEEDAYDLREVSSDVEMHPDDLDSGDETDASRFEEVNDEAPAKAAKRARESDAAEGKADAESTKKSKKQKAEGGKAVPAAEAPKAEKADKKKKEKKSEGEDKKEKSEEKKADPKVGVKKTIAGGVVIQDATIGKGPMAKKGNTVSMRYVGKLTNGKIFDKNVSGKPFTFHLGKGEVIKGWDEGIVGMQPGGERMLTIPPSMGYGSKRQDPIPANSTLIFEVKLLSIK
ncbi:hypothetical protein CPC08DRAFT_815290 [Agrocybe pediades]|nr:hypothetical protein CPC08DRAFT_815290 [Agrocybe pediades]